jgi:hypothetical protein
MPPGFLPFDLNELFGVHPGLIKNLALFLQVSEIVGLVLSTLHHRVVAFVDESLYVFAKLVVGVSRLLVHEFTFWHKHPVQNLSADYVLEKRDVKRGWVN